MARPLRAGLWLLGALLLVVVAGAGVLALTFDPNSQKTRVAEAVRRATGRELTLAGPLTLSWGLSPGLQALDVWFANRPGGTRPQMATAARVDARIALLPLLMGRVEIASITLIGPDILLETDAKGVGNWQVERPEAVTRSADNAPPHARREPIAIQSLRIEDGRVTWHDGQTGWTQAIALPRARVDVDATSTNIVAEGGIAATSGHLRANLGTPAALTGAQAEPFPVKLALTLGDATFGLDGTAEWPVAAHGLQGRITAAVPDLTALAPIVQRRLPPLHDVRLDAMLTGGWVVQTATLHIGASDLATTLPGLALNQLDLASKQAGQPARLEADGTLAATPWRVASSLLRAGQGVALRGLDLQSATADVQGDVAVTMAPRLTVKGTLVSHHLDIDQLRALASAAPASAPPASSAAAAAPPPASETKPATTQPLFSRAPLPWDLLHRMDADLQATVDVIELAHANYRSVAGHLVLQNGMLRIDPLSVQAPEGHIDASLTAEAAPPAAAIVLRSPALALDPLAQAFGLPGGSTAAVEIDAALQGTGASPHDVAAHLNGHVGLAMVDGEIANATLLALLGPALHGAGTAGIGLDPVGRSEVRCVALRLNVADGKASIVALKLDTTRLALEGGGDIDLGAETLALRLRPTVRLGSAGVTAPVRLDGGLAHPAVVLDAPGQGGRPGVVIGGLPSAQDTCTPELTAARDGRAGRLPSEAPVKSIKPADLLRSLFR